MKQYKKHLPIHTISQIRNILSELGLILHENHKGQDGFYSCRLRIGNNDLYDLDIGTNGKGTSFEYSLASGLAEFMERLQNRLLIHPKKKSNYKVFSDNSINRKETEMYSYDKRESKVEATTLDAEICTELMKLCNIQTLDAFRSFISVISQAPISLVPFYSFFDKSEVFLPIDLIWGMTGSNGMASGNTPQEAILQAVCEIFERYVVSEIYWNQLTPPAISIEKFAGTSIYNKMQHLLSKGRYEITIKDCSLGKGIPAIGVLMIDQEKGKYNFKVGCDFVPYVALERCFTELYQGLEHFLALPYHFLDAKDFENKKEAEQNLSKIFSNGTGFWPISILNQQPSYTFIGFNEDLGITNKSDLLYSFDLIKNMGHNIFIRNNSFLGFPTYYVVIPGMSQTKKNDTNTLEEHFSIHRVLAKINAWESLTQADKIQIFETIDENFSYIAGKMTTLSDILVKNTNKDLNTLQIELFMCMLAYQIGNTPKALAYLLLYLDDKSRIRHKYFYACADFLKLLVARNESDEILHIMSHLYGIKLAKEIISDFKEPNKIFQHYHMPNCPCCDKCSLLNECKVQDIHRINITLQNRATDIQQSNIEQLMKAIDD
ncbi:YcaO-like family protein [Bacteroides sp. 51]|uniref:YcaO-like family protein n=1 Tax=Bacteroides sp. 51 TaxID=2302938 RepID=UPI0013D35020|nr:YcaO-like family protein [Bacteroides sp. 51]NDV83399.1 hypothetical protein [Bacteroides sp. 51]